MRYFALCVRRLDDDHHYDVIDSPTTTDNDRQYMTVGQTNAAYTADPRALYEVEVEANEEIDVSEPASSGSPVSPVSPVYLHPL